MRCRLQPLPEPEALADPGERGTSVPGLGLICVQCKYQGIDIPRSPSLFASLCNAEQVLFATNKQLIINRRGSRIDRFIDAVRGLNL